jgi:hypothetical protein
MSEAQFTGKLVAIRANDRGAPDEQDYEADVDSSFTGSQVSVLRFDDRDLAQSLAAMVGEIVTISVTKGPVQ